MLTLVDYHVHLLGHLDVENPAERLNDFIKTAIRRGVSEIGGIPVTLGSDAHAPENAGRDRAHAADLARSVGYTSLATFSRRRMVSKTI